MQKAGFIGLGIMGKPMAKNLVKKGVKLMVYDLNTAAVDELAAMGAERGTLETIGKECDVIMCILPTGAIVQSILFGENGLANYLAPGKVVCDMSSVTPGESQACYEKLKAIGVGFVDAPVSGGEPKAITGELAIMCGGDQKDFDAMKPCFDCIGTSANLGFKKTMISFTGGATVASLVGFAVIMILNACSGFLPGLG